MNRILLADPNPALNSALALLLETRLGAQIVGQVSSMGSLLSEAAATCPEIIILDWGLPGNPQDGRLEALRRQTPHSRLIVTSTRPEIASQATSADAFLCKTDLPEVVLAILQGA